MRLIQRYRRLTFWNKFAVWAGAASIAGLLLTVLQIFLARGEAMVEPRYAVDWHDIIAETTDKVLELKLAWNDKQYPNLYATRIAIWNAGRSFMDKSVISTTDPIIVISPEGIQVLSAKVTYTSRPSLTISARIGVHNGKEVVLVNIEGDDALEYQEGGILRLLYSKPKDYGPFGDIRGDFKGPGPSDFEVSGRVKGTKHGFQRISWSDATSGVIPAWFRWLAVIIWMLHLLFIVIIGLRASSEPARRYEIVLGGFAWLFSLVLAIWFTYHFLTTNFGYPSWIGYAV